MRLVVIIPTFGRKWLLPRMIAHLEQQTRLPDEVIISAPDETHVEPCPSDKFEVRTVFGKKGSSAQRNSALDHAQPQSDIITFLDDDFLPAQDYLALVEQAFNDHPEWAVVMGHAALDGAHGAGYSFDEGISALRTLAAARPSTAPQSYSWSVHVGAYGCNMSVRAHQVGGLRFDERLVLYGWQEDIDFTSQLRVFGTIAGLDILYGVHLGVKSARVSGVRFGYSQIVNPIYLIRKGTVPVRFAINLMSRNLAANVLRCLWPEPWVDRRGRLKGNLIAAWHLVRGRVEPEYILNL